ncbi:MAG: pyrroline-5-carboxylate reductase [Methylococcales bacterium]|nr:pyrroline-5-carboxylate reductase [Methylococcales bacterium]
MKNHSIGFIGGGNMATSLIHGLLASGHNAETIWVSDIDQERLATLNCKWAINVTEDYSELIDAVEVIVLAVKPQVMSEVARTLAPLLQNKKRLIISIAAGISQASLAHWLGSDRSIVRCMPNTPSLVQSGVTGLHANAHVTHMQRDLAENILRSVGVSFWLEQESELDVVTAISGSGPAYYFLLMEAMEDAAVALGLTEQQARLFVLQTALGAAKIALEANESPAELRQKVTSPGGTTEQALAVFDEGGFSTLVAKAIHAAHTRAQEMAEQSGAKA